MRLPTRVSRPIGFIYKDWFEVQGSKLKVKVCIGVGGSLKTLTH